MSKPQHPAAIDVGGMPYLRDAKGSLVPIATIKAADLLMDETVRDVLVAARALSEQIAVFKVQAFEAVSALQALLAQDYGAPLGGKKGNITLVSFDGCEKVQVQVADLLEFGPELQSAKALIDECLTEWAVGSAIELRALVNRVFQVDKEGKINRAELFMLLRVDIADERWQRAMDAIRDSMRVIGSRTYIRFYDRPAPDAAWHAVTIDMASA
ncbi:sulfate transporter [Sphingomonas panacis]|uniref:Sulfate transporter n=2 Tax=Sphingomonas panacis TaxID=1560345 RepID=A0A1B3ZE79_9SPHN|nr:sulfate transporter [Sphingomonas panacis]